MAELEPSRCSTCNALKSVQNMVLRSVIWVSAIS